jgi:hypothetical protein
MPPPSLPPPAGQPSVGAWASQRNLQGIRTTNGLGRVALVSGYSGQHRPEQVPQQGLCHNAGYYEPWGSQY